MIADLLFTLAAAPQASSESTALLVLMGCGLGVFLTVIVGGVMFRKERARRIEAESLMHTAAAQRHHLEEQAARQDNGMLDQHKRINDLQIAKLTAEVELLQNQVKAKALDEDRIEASKEYHELMVEKTRLEMDNLRLHLMELRKRARTEDWRSEE